VVAMGTALDAGTRAAGFEAFRADDDEHTARLVEVLSERDERLLTAYLDGTDGVPAERLQEALCVQSRRGDVHAVFFGAAVTGAGVSTLMSSVPALLPWSPGDA